MTNFSISFLTLTAPEAVEMMGSLQSIDQLPDAMADGVIDTIEALMALLPDAADEYHFLQDSGLLGAAFNHAREAHRVLVPALQSATFPLETARGPFDLDSPLALALSPLNALALLRDLAEDETLTDREFDAVAAMVDALFGPYPAAKAIFEEQLETAKGFEYVADAHDLLTEAMRAEASQPAMAA